MTHERGVWTALVKRWGSCHWPPGAPYKDKTMSSDERNSLVYRNPDFTGIGVYVTWVARADMGLPLVVKARICWKHVSGTACLIG